MLFLSQHRRLVPGRCRVVGCSLKILIGLSFRSAALSREESAVSLLAASRFLADKAGFGMTRVRLFFRKLHHYLLPGWLAFFYRLRYS